MLFDCVNVGCLFCSGEFDEKNSRFVVAEVEHHYSNKVLICGGLLIPKGLVPENNRDLLGINWYPNGVAEIYHLSKTSIVQIQAMVLKKLF